MHDAKKLYELTELYLVRLIREQKQMIYKSDDSVDSYNMGWKEGKLAGLEEALNMLNSLKSIIE